MSGPKTSSYTVSTNELRRRRALTEAWTKTEALVLQLQATYKNIDDFNHNGIIKPIEVPREIFSVSQARQFDDLNRVEAYNRQIRQACDDAIATFRTEKAAQELEAEVQKALFDKAMEEARKAFEYKGPRETSTDVIERYREKERAKRREEKYLSYKETVERYLGRVPATIQATVRASINDVVKRILDPDTPNKEAQVAELNYQVQVAKKAADKLEVEAKVAIEKLEELRGYDSPELAVIKTMLAKIVQKEIRTEKPLFTEKWNTEIAEAKREAKAALDAEYVQDSISKSLNKLGYNIKEEFSTLFSKKEAIKIQKPGWNDYFVQFRLTGEGDVNYNLVRVGDPDDSDITNDQKRKDRSMEEKWCGDFSQLVKSMEKKGIQHKLTRHLEIGEVPVQVVKDTNISGKTIRKSTEGKDVKNTKQQKKSR